jgi:hypothetical protein
MSARPPWKPPVDPPWGATLNTGFGTHFRAPLISWFFHYVNGDQLTIVGLKAHLTWTRFAERSRDINTFIDEMFKTSDAVILLALDAAQYELSADPNYGHPNREDPGARLNDLLEAGGSAWRVRDDGSGLERRVPEAVRVAVEGAIASAREASADAADHLTNAWRHAYGIAPEATPAYGEAIRAVESAASRLVEPNNAKATLGTMIGAIRARPGAWTMAMTGPVGSTVDGTPVVEMMDLLWKGQTDRHGANPTIPVTPKAAEAAVHLAVLLVQWWTSSGVTRA